MGVINRVHVVLWGSRDGFVWIDGELDVDLHGGVGEAIGSHRRGVIDRVHVVLWGSRDGSVWIDGELDVGLHGGVGGAIGFHRRVLNRDASEVVDFVVVECVGVSDKSTLSDPTCGGV